MFRQRRRFTARLGTGERVGSFWHEPGASIGDRWAGRLDLPVVACCRACNEASSLDEEYVACVVEVAVCGGLSPTDQRRPKVARKLAERHPLSARIAASFVESASSTAVEIEVDRISRVLEKVARGLGWFECGLPTADMTASTAFTRALDSRRSRPRLLVALSRSSSSSTTSLTHSVRPLTSFTRTTRSMLGAAPGDHSGSTVGACTGRVCRGSERSRTG